MSDYTREDVATRCQKVLQYSQNLFHSNPDWVTFFREVLGVNGAARKLFPAQQDYLTFERSQEFSRIQQMVNALRNRKGANGHVEEPTRVITVRLPESLHEALKQEATDHSTSMNKLCISKLLQVLSNIPKNSPQRQPAAAAPPTPAPAPQPQAVATGGYSYRPAAAAPQPSNPPAANPAPARHSGGYVSPQSQPRPNGFDPNRGGYRG